MFSAWTKKKEKNGTLEQYGRGNGKEKKMYGQRIRDMTLNGMTNNKVRLTEIVKQK